MIVVTHELREVSDLADRIVVLSGGTVALETHSPSDERLAEFGVRPC